MFQFKRSPQTQQKEDGSNKQMNKKDILKPVFIVLFIAALGGFIWSFTSYQELKGEVIRLTSPEARQELSRIEIEKLLASVAQHIVLTEDEQPTVATIQDIDALVEAQPVFQGAENGDKVLVYSDRAIIYSPTKDILIKVVPVFIENNDSEQAAQDQSVQGEQPQAESITDRSQIITLDVRNGSRTSGAAQSLGDQLSGNPVYEVINITNAANLDYGETILVNATGKDISALELELGVPVVPSLPEGEQLTGADVVIIIGNQ